jgi:hypothetical protein
MKKKGRGGSGRGQGRKKILKTARARLTIGRMCEERQNEREGNALRRYEKQLPIRRIRAAQKRLSKLKTESERRKLIKVAIAPILNEPRSRVFRRADVRQFENMRLINLAKFRRREMTRKEICLVVSNDCKKLGWKQVTPNYVDECWKEYRKLIADSALHHEARSHGYYADSPLTAQDHSTIEAFMLENDRKYEELRSRDFENLLHKIQAFPHANTEIASQTAHEFILFGKSDARVRGITDDEWIWKRSRFLAGHR